VRGDGHEPDVAGVTESSVHVRPMSHSFLGEQVMVTGRREGDALHIFYALGTMWEIGATVRRDSGLN